MPILIILAAFVGSAVAAVAYIPIYGFISGTFVAILIGNMLAVLVCLFISVQKGG